MDGKKKIIRDSLLSIAGVVIMNVIVQFIAYPLIQRREGISAYGEVLYLMIFVNVFSAAAGSGVNLARMKASATRETANGDYLVSLLLVLLVGIPVSVGLAFLGHIRFSLPGMILFILLLIVTALRFYCDVDFKLETNYVRYFVFYLFLSAGYVLGLLAYEKSKSWYLIFLAGEVLAVLFTLVRGNILTRKALACSKEIRGNIRTTLVLVSSILVSNFIFNADRMILKLLVSSSAVSVYYIASLFGKTLSLLTLPLNNVAIGYLAKYTGKFTKKMMNALMGITAGFCLVFTVACFFASRIILPFLYPDSYRMAEPYYVIANLSSIVFFCTSFLTIFLLRFGKEKCQLYANIIYAVSFAAFCIPGCIFGGLQGLCVGLLASNLLRLLAVVVMSYHYTERSGQREHA